MIEIDRAGAVSDLQGRAIERAGHCCRHSHSSTDIDSIRRIGEKAKLQAPTDRYKTAIRYRQRASSSLTYHEIIVVEYQARACARDGYKADRPRTMVNIVRPFIPDDRTAIRNHQCAGPAVPDGDATGCYSRSGTVDSGSTDRTERIGQREVVEAGVDGGAIQNVECTRSGKANRDAFGRPNRAGSTCGRCAHHAGHRADQDLTAVKGRAVRNRQSAVITEANSRAVRCCRTKDQIWLSHRDGRADHWTKTQSFPPRAPYDEYDAIAAASHRRCEARGELSQCFRL